MTHEKFFAVIVFASAFGCGSTANAPPPAAAAPHAPPATVAAPAPAVDWEREARLFLEFYNPTYQALSTEFSRAAFKAATNVSESNTAARTAANSAMSAFTGSVFVIERAKALLEHENEYSWETRKQLRQVLFWAADAPQTVADLSRRRIQAEADQSARLDGFQFCLDRRGGTCRRRVITNDLDEILTSSRDLRARLKAWEASKEVGSVLRDGIIELQSLRNGVARAMGHPDFFSFQVSAYDMTTPEMMEMLDRLVRETRPLFEQLHCYARYELAERYGVENPPQLIPAHWIGNRWAQSWPGLVEGVDMDSYVRGKTKEWIVEQAERFYVSMGFPELPDSFWAESDLYPVPEGEIRKKNAHATAWHIDLDHDVRSIMSVEPNWEWFGTTHHELGHIYYYLSYTRPEVPPLLREGANRAFHEGIGDLISLAASQESYLREVGLVQEGQSIDDQQWLLDNALTGPIVFLAWSAGTMSQFEKSLYADELPRDQLNAKWWELVSKYQGVAPPSERPADGCDGCTKTHINDDPAGYYDYAIANVILYQLHDHICREIVHADPRDCNYFGRRDVGEFLQRVLSLGMTRDWRQVMREFTGRDLTAEPMLEFYRPLQTYLEEQNRGRSCGLPPL